MPRSRREAKLEADYKTGLQHRLGVLFPGCVILKNDSGYLQGVPDWTIFWKQYWAMLEAKAFSGAEVQVNQPYWVEHFNSMYFAAFIYPENEEEVLYALQQAFGIRRPTRLS